MRARWTSGRGLAVAVAIVAFWCGVLAARALTERRSGAADSAPGPVAVAETPPAPAAAKASPPEPVEQLGPAAPTAPTPSAVLVAPPRRLSSAVRRAATPAPADETKPPTLERGSNNVPIIQ
jgi:type IV secretory pathway VirB10-like protein